VTPAGQKAIDRAKQTGGWTADRGPQIDLSMPSDLSRRLKRNKRAAAFFNDLAPGYRRQYVAWIASAKRETTRQRRLEEAIDLLEAGKKLGMR
jgi:uncharacterized protein YdeI (YjbR/CyaY-like superfamily)